MSIHQPPIPTLSLEESTKLLLRMKKNVMDFYSVTAMHYINAGEEGKLHFNLLLNTLISDVNNANLEELNIAHGIILYKGHGKPKSSDRSYRTISSCSFLSKAIDLHIRHIYLSQWNACQAATQYQEIGFQAKFILIALFKLKYKRSKPFKNAILARASTITCRWSWKVKHRCKI